MHLGKKSPILFLPLALLTASALSAQSNCHYHYNLSAVGTTNIINNDNSTCNATAWTYSYVVQGFSAISVQLESAFSANPQITNPPNFIPFPGTVTLGSNPSTTTPGGVVSVLGMYQFIRLNLTAITGTGSVDIYLQGYSTPPTFTTNGTSGGSSSSTGNATSVNGASIPANLPCTATNNLGQIIPATNCSSVTPTTKVVKGTTAGAIIPASPGIDYQSPISFVVSDYVTGSGNNGIANAAAVCASIAPTQCIIDIPTGYTNSEQIQGFVSDLTQGDISAYPSNVFFTDNRNGKIDYINNNAGSVYGNQASTYYSHFVYWTPQTGSSNIFFRANKFTLLGGGSFTANGSGTSNYIPNYSVYFSKTYGQVIQNQSGTVSMAPADVILSSDTTASQGGVGSPGYAEGTKWRDILVYHGTLNQGTTPFRFSTTTVGSNVNTIAVGNITQGIGTLGQGRWLYDTNTTPTTNTVTAVTGSDFANSPATVTYGSAVTPSDARGLVSTPVTTLGIQTISPTYTFGNLSNFLTTKLVCVADQGNEAEMIYPTSVSPNTFFKLSLSTRGRVTLSQPVAIVVKF